MWLSLSLGAGLLAMISKQFSVTLPVAIAIMDAVVISGGLATARKRIDRVAPFAPLLLVAPLLTTLLGKGEVADLGQRADNLLSPYSYLITEFNVIVFVYLRLMFYPAGQNLDYDYPVSRSFMDSAPAFIILVTILAASVALFWRNKVASFGILFFFLSLAVESSFFVLEDLVFEHRMYLPMAGILIASASLGRDALEKAPAGARIPVTAALIAILCVPLSIATLQRNAVWSSPRALWTDVVAKSPRKVRGYNNLATVALAEKNYDEALALLDKALKIHPENAFTLMNVGVVTEKMGNVMEAANYYLKAVKIRPEQDGAASLLGQALFKLKRYDDSAKFLLLALNLKPRDIAVRINLGVAFYHGGRLNDAATVFTSVFKQEPDNAKARFYLAQVYEGMGEKAKAAENLEKAKALGYKVD